MGRPRTAGIRSLRAFVRNETHLFSRGWLQLDIQHDPANDLSEQVPSGGFYFSLALKISHTRWYISDTRRSTGSQGMLHGLHGGGLGEEEVEG